MDDFLHNLRSGKLKQVDRSNRSYGDQQFKGGQRRNLDRRKGHYDNKESFERLNVIKEVLERLVESQRSMADAYQARTRAEERKATALEVLAKNLYRMINPSATDAEDLFAPGSSQSLGVQTEPAFEDAPASAAEAYNRGNEENGARTDEDEEIDTYSAAEEVEDEDDMRADDDDHTASARLTEVDRQTLFRVIDQMRTEGSGWEKIARHITSQGYPTISGKGNWRGVMVKNLYEKMATAS
jgi:hypothetical protein